LNSQSTFSPAGGGKGKTMKIFFIATWLTIAVLSFGYLANNFIELHRFIEADLCLILEKR
jgi:hypothetical protein